MTTGGFLYSNWLRLPINTRHQLALQFGVEKKGSTEVFNNEIVKDGYNIFEIEAALNIDVLQEYTGSQSTDMAILWELMVAKIEGRDIQGMVSEVIIINEVELRPKRFCEYCDSKGVKHKKVCTRPQLV